jgi:hypothetical protein
VRVASGAISRSDCCDDGGDDAQLLGPGRRLFIDLFQLLFAERHLELLLLLINLLHLLLIHFLFPLPIFLLLLVLLLLHASARSINLAGVLEFFGRGAVDLFGFIRT